MVQWSIVPLLTRIGHGNHGYEAAFFQAFVDKNGAGLEGKKLSAGPAKPAPQKLSVCYKLHCSRLSLRERERNTQFQVTTESRV